MNIEQYLDALIKCEGGYVNDPLDHGHATKFGIKRWSHMFEQLKAYL